MLGVYLIIYVCILERLPEHCILAGKKTQILFLGLYFFKKLWISFDCLIFFNSLFHFLLNAIGLVSYSRRRLQ